MILDIWGPYTQNCVDRGGGGGGGGGGGWVRLVVNEWMNEWNAFVVIYSAPNRACRKRSRNSVSSAACYAFNSFLLVSRKRLYDIYIPWFDRFLRRNGISAALQ